MKYQTQTSEISDKRLVDLADEYARSRSTIWVAVDSFPSDLHQDWNTGVYALTYCEPSNIPEPLQKKDIMDDDIDVVGLCHGPGTSDDMMTLAYLDAIEYICHTLEMISQFDPNGKVPFRKIRCLCRSGRWLSQFSSTGNTVSVEPISEMSTLPVSLISDIIGSLTISYGIAFTFEFDSNDDGCGLIGMCEDAFKANKENHHGKNK